jgi:mannobiose 2-epimerase
MNEAKSMNTHLHVLEAYTNLYRVWQEPLVKERLEGLLDIFTGHILDAKTHHFRLFFDEAWNSKSPVVSFGHDIEGSWLLCEAAEAVGGRARLSDMRGRAAAMADAVFREGLDSDGSLLYEGGPQGIIDTDRHWWPQAEAVVGFINAYAVTGEERYWNAAMGAWEYINGHIIDKKRGEWFWRISREGVPYGTEFKVSEWKCPYHNSRMCLEGVYRLDALLGKTSKSLKAKGNIKGK